MPCHVWIQIIIWLTHTDVFRRVSVQNVEETMCLKTSLWVGNHCLHCAGVQMDHASLLKQFEHLDPHNQNTFEAKDLELLISTVRPSETAHQ